MQQIIMFVSSEEILVLHFGVHANVLIIHGAARRKRDDWLRSVFLRLAAHFSYSTF